MLFLSLLYFLEGYMKTQTFTQLSDHHTSIPDSHPCSTTRFRRAPGSITHSSSPGWARWVCMCVFSCSVMSSSLRPFGLQPTRLLCPWDILGKYTGVGCPFLFQEIFPAQGSNLCLLSPLFWQMGSLPLSHLGSQVGLGAYKKMSNILLTKSVSCGSLPLLPVSTLRARTESDICSSLTLQNY